MRRLAVTITGAVLVGFGALGCGHKDASLCDFYQSLGAGYTDSKGYVPSDIRDKIDEYC